MQKLGTTRPDPRCSQAMDSSVRSRKRLSHLLLDAFPLGERGSFSGLLEAIQGADIAECSPAGLENGAEAQPDHKEVAEAR